MNTKKNNKENKALQLSNNRVNYLKNISFTEESFKYYQTLNKRTGNTTKSKQKWRESDGIDYPVTTYKASKLKEETTHE